MIVLGITLILAVANIIDLTIRVNYKRVNYKRDKKDEPTDDENDN